MPNIETAMSLKNQVALVTGASRGIGLAIARRFCQAGAGVVVCSRSEGTIQSVTQKLTAEGFQVKAMVADISNRDEVDALVAFTLDQFSKIDILVNNAGITQDALLMRMKDDDWDHVIQTNLTGTFYCTRSVIRPMIRQKSGRIINISSIVGTIGNAGQANYAASKAGIIGFTKSVAKEVASRGITANVIAPGFITTDMTAQLSEADQERMLELIPLGRLGVPEDIADATFFLGSSGSGYITGQVIHVNGGMAMNG